MKQTVTFRRVTTEAVTITFEVPELATKAGIEMWMRCGYMGASPLDHLKLDEMANTVKTVDTWGWECVKIDPSPEPIKRKPGRPRKVT